MNPLAMRLIVLLMACTGFSGCQTAAAKPELSPVLMVCEHGSVKSLMAASLFNQAAMKRHLPYRAIARGVSPDPSVPAPIAAALGQEGFDVANFVPTRVSAVEVARAARVVVIGLNPEALESRASAPIDAWQDVPAASVDYAGAKAALQQHVDALLDELDKDGPR
jgi:protein-tyrosine-phosphatase